ncbi:Rhomboid protease GlpG [Aquisphaera giovannonii]|uniref:Rhomboid protease GlpG n=1 Tax=Aquisphaera giovannonii TaxID=406548 RepID=A0A5B9VYZ8_9BACT|nr:rhomboid family intramembrane serine protease [Aquisphaera giovannonii]QEH33181.1 Rhomboid protease GlpG [Aquisphaera giovannonii]
MRQIGTLPKGLDSKVLEDYLLSLGIKTRIDPSPAGSVVWVIDEDHVDRARKEMEEYVGRPADPRFVEATNAATEHRKREAALDRQYRKNYREVTDSWAGLQVRRRPITVALCLASIAVFAVIQFAPPAPGGGQSELSWSVKNALLFSPIRADKDGVSDSGLDAIRRGEVWRLITPIFLHFGPLHLVFNCMAIMFEGTLIETRRGTLRLAILVVTSAVISNLAEHVYSAYMYPDRLHIFGGLSGVSFALFGYLWVKGRFEPEQGMILHPNTITTGVMWLVLCMTGALGPIANAAHVAGLVVGIFFGLMRY